jgi:hypothetical protein
MQLVRIAGPTEAMLRLAEVEGLDFERTSASRLDDDTWQVAGYATDDALAEIETRGLTAELVVPAEQVAEERQLLYAALTRDEPDATAPDDDPTTTSPGDDPEATSPGDDPTTTAPGDDPDGGEA